MAGRVGDVTTRCDSRVIERVVCSATRLRPANLQVEAPDYELPYVGLMDFDRKRVLALHQQ